jgi:putative tryptophan/tyrosine transport system substrate-binding protein
MKRRAFIAALGGAVAWPIVARAQQPARLPTVGFFGPVKASIDRLQIAIFVERLRGLGWIEGRNVAMEYRWAEGRMDRYADIAAELVRQKVDVIVTYSTSTVVALKRATPVIPIVFVSATDPVGNGLVESLARPGGNATGLSNQSADSVGKRLEILREVVPTLRRLAILYNVGAPNAVLEKEEVQAAAQAVGLEVVTMDIRRPDDITPGFEAIKGRTDALYVVMDPVVSTNRIQINTSAVRERLPTLYVFRELVEAGGLMSYGPNQSDQFRRAAELVDKILRGTKPADIPVEQPTKFDFVINMKTAKALGLDLPQTLLARADEVIE